MLGLLVKKDSRVPQELELAWSLTLSLGEQCPRAWGGVVQLSECGASQGHWSWRGMSVGLTEASLELGSVLG